MGRLGEHGHHGVRARLFGCSRRLRGRGRRRQAPWPMALHDNGHSGTAAVAGPTSGHVLWTRDLGGKITPRPAESYSSSSLFGGSAHYGDNSGALHVVRERSGSLVATDHGSKGIWAAQAIDSKGDVYFGTRCKHIYGPHGTKLFDVTASAPIDSYPALTGNGDLIIGDQAGTLYAIG